MKEENIIYLACSNALKVKSTGCHCSQACLCALAPFIGIDEGYAMKLSAAFGGGMRHQQLCGAVAAAGIALGLKFGTSSFDKPASDRLGKLTEEFVERFKNELGTTVCGEILKDKLASFCWEMPEKIEFINTLNNENCNEFNLKVPACGKAITNAVEITLEIIQRENGASKQ
jgi:C_GCAxxG_C_C family probable redox protein